MRSGSAQTRTAVRRAGAVCKARAFVIAAALGAAGCWGGPVPQSAECAAYVQCIEAIDRAAGQTTDLDRYVEGGACWDNPELAHGCTRSCVRALDRLRAREPTRPAECGP